MYFERPLQKLRTVVVSQIGLPDGRYFTADLAEAGKRLVF